MGTILLRYSPSQVCQTGNEDCRAVAEFLVRSASAPFFQILSQWINRGIIVDHGKDFYVEDNEASKAL